MRLNRFLVIEGYAASRRKADFLILEGKILVNGKKAVLGQNILSHDKVKVFGKELSGDPDKKYSYGVLCKPIGFVCTHAPGKKSVSNLLPSGIGWKWAGRLDAESEGLMIISDDGNFLHRASHPSFGCDKEYEVTLDRELNREEIVKSVEGIEIEGKLMKFEKVEPDGKIIRLTLRTGYNRQIRKMLGFFSVSVRRLVRTRHGAVLLGNLKPGEYRTLTGKEKEYFMNLTKHEIKL